MTSLVVAQQTFRRQRWITAIGVILLMLKFTAYYITQSVAILTDALESIVNVIAGLVSLYSLYVAAKPRDYNHPYGHGKAEFLSAGVEGSLIGLAGIWIWVEAIKKMRYPSPIHQLDVGILLIAASGIINFVIGHVAETTGKKNNSMAIAATGKHLKSDAYSTAGLIAGLIILYLTNIYWIDSALAMLFGTIIIITGINIVRQSVAGIMDEADITLLNRLIILLNANRQKNWIDLHNLRIIKYGNQLHVDCHLTVPWYLNVREAHLEVEQLEKLKKQELGGSLELFTHVDSCLDFSCPICTIANCPARQHPFQQSVEWTFENIVDNKKHRLETIH